MSDTNDKGGARKLAVFAIPESTDGEKPWSGRRLASRS